MRDKGLPAAALVMILAVTLLAISCAKKVVKTQQPVSIAEPEAQKAEAQKASDKPAEEAKPAGQVEKDRLRAEADAREAALRAFLGEKIHFAFDSYLLSDQAREILVDKADYLRTNWDIKVTVEGHCDDRGTSEYNIALGERRAESVKKFLVNLGISTNRLNTVSYGEERPIALGDDEASWAKNRRAQFVINGSTGNRMSVKN